MCLGHDRTSRDSEAMSDHAQLVRELDEALAPGRLLLLCKPVIGPPDGRLAGVAWLPLPVRLRAHTETAISPVSFEAASRWPTNAPAVSVVRRTLLDTLG